LEIIIYNYCYIIICYLNYVKKNLFSGDILTVKVAVASSDGKYINQHFGHADLFLIFLINTDGVYKYIETRKNVPSCTVGGHSAGALEGTLDIIGDVDIVLVSQIGPGASEFLLSNGIQPLEMPGFIDEQLKKLQNSLVLE
jgi:nitrogen fixation protein NifX